MSVNDESTLYEIVDEFQEIMDLLDEFTDPKPRCKVCYDQGVGDSRLLRKSVAGDKWVPCPACDNDSGFMQPMDDEGMLEGIQNAIDDIDLTMRVKVENIISLCAHWDAMAGMIKLEETQLHDRRKAYENKKERLRTYLARHMDRAGITKIETSVRTAGLRQGVEVVIVDDEDKLPQGTFDTEYIIKPDKRLIKERFKQDIETEGAHMERRPSYVVFR